MQGAPGWDESRADDPHDSIGLLEERCIFTDQFFLDMIAAFWYLEGKGCIPSLQ